MDTALIIVDMQMTMQDRIDSGCDHVNPNAPHHIQRLASAFRGAGKPIIHVRHQDDDVASSLHPAAPGFEPMPCGRTQGIDPFSSREARPLSQRPRWKRICASRASDG